MSITHNVATQDASCVGCTAITKGRLIAPNGGFRFAVCDVCAQELVGHLADHLHAVDLPDRAARAKVKDADKAAAVIDT